MEEKAIPSPRSGSQSPRGLSSCWGRLKLKLPWRRMIARRYRQIKASLMARGKSSSVARFGYDPLSYAQNFDQGWDFDDDDDDQDLSRRTFSARFVAPLSKPLQDL